MARAIHPTVAGLIVDFRENPAEAMAYYARQWIETR
jgi:hypothetical protein